MERTSHRAQRKALLLLVIGIAHNEHTVAVVIPVTRDLVKIPLCKQRSLGQLTAACLLNVLYPPLQKLYYPRALWQKDRQSLSDVVNSREIFKLASKLVVVAQFSLLKHLQMLLQHRSLGERNTVNSAKLLVVRSIAPVCARAGEQLCRLDSRNVHNVRTCTQVNKIALLVE